MRANRQYNQRQKDKGPKEIVRRFLLEVRSGLYPGRAGRYIADEIAAHQVRSENESVIIRTPIDYASHIEQFLEQYGRFSFQITELIGEGDKVYARWVQKGAHLANIEGYKPTGLILQEYTSAIYRVENGKIAEYWLQTDRMGMEQQLRSNLIFEYETRQDV